MTRFLALDSKTRNALLKKLRAEGGTDAIVSFLEEMDPNSIERLIEKFTGIAGDCPLVRTLEEILQTMRTSKPSVSDYRVVPRSSKKRDKHAT